jgi:hypothetical protein
MPDLPGLQARERGLRKAARTEIRWSWAIEAFRPHLSRSFSTEWAHQGLNPGLADYEFVPGVRGCWDLTESLYFWCPWSSLRCGFSVRDVIFWTRVGYSA